MLLGNLQSDAIESRFGWLRQLSGANYYISMRQVMESDRKIKALSLVKFSGFVLTEMDEAIQSESSQPQPQDDNVAGTIADALTCEKFSDSSDANTIYYISGATARSVIRYAHDATIADHCSSPRMKWRFQK